MNNSKNKPNNEKSWLFKPMLNTQCHICDYIK